MTVMTFTDPRLADLDGFRVEIDLAHERADVILDRPPFNIISMTQRDQLRPVFEALDQDARVRVIALRAVGEHFSSGGNIKGFIKASPEHVSKLAWNVAAPARCSKPVIVANRDFARLRFRHRLRDVPLRAPGAEARPNLRLWRIGAGRPTPSM
jgi:2-oxoglutaroyl-CoA hydrolase